jgi:KaiC/GvpD/RAD55 family RecA-like ATPase
MEKMRIKLRTSSKESPAQEKKQASEELVSSRKASSLTDSLDGIAKFLELKGHTLLIKGAPGAGKTTLALQLLKHFGEANTLYVSSRESSEKLGSEITWAKSALKKAMFQDLRLSSASTIIDEVLAAQKKRQIRAIVLDTWDGLAKEIPDERERLKSEKMLISLADGSNFRIIFVSEEPHKTTMDYLVDGIIELDRFEAHGRILREIEMKKLRGTLIEQHKYLYTLAGGMFRHFTPYSTPLYTTNSKLPVIRDASRGESYSFGSVQLDKIFGGIGKASTFTIQYDENVSYSAIRLIDIPAIINTLNIGRGVIMVPLPGASIEHILKLLKPFVKQEALTQRFRIAATKTSETEVKAPRFLLAPGQIAKSQDTFNTAFKEVKQNSIDGGVLLIEAISLLENIHATEIDSMLGRLADRVARVQQESRDAFMLLMQVDSLVRSRVLALSSHYVKMFVKDRSVLLTGEKPSTIAYVLEHDAENPVLPTLTPVV